MLENRGFLHMRLRNIPRAGSVLNECKEVVKNEIECRGTWHKIFGSPNPVHIEIGMGKGQFLLTLAGQNPDINYIGIERYSSVLLRAVEKYYTICIGDPSSASALPPDAGSQIQPQESQATGEAGQRFSNIRFICMDARNAADVFAPGEVDRIYLNFSDPWPKARHAARRLTSREFLSRYEKILTENGSIEFKTDNRLLFDFSVAEIEACPFFQITACTYDLHGDPDMNQGNIMTEYEEKFSSLGNPIYKLIAGRKK